MKINGKEVNVNSLVKNINKDSSMLKMRGNGIYLSDDEVNILNKLLDIGQHDDKI